MRSEKLENSEKLGMRSEELRYRFAMILKMEKRIARS